LLQLYSSQQKDSAATGGAVDMFTDKNIADEPRRWTWSAALSLLLALAAGVLFLMDRYSDGSSLLMFSSASLLMTPKLKLIRTPKAFVRIQMVVIWIALAKAFGVLATDSIDVWWWLFLILYGSIALFLVFLTVHLIRHRKL
jgi:hypothetical protein